jgi:glycosyltransferase involved in cell wall biosynthesis
MKVIVSHPTGNANVRAAAGGLSRADMLEKFYTTIAAFPGGWLDKVSNFGPLAEMKRRQYDMSIQPFTQANPWYETGRLLASKLKLHSLTAHEKGIFSVDGVYRQHDRWVASKLNGLARHNHHLAVYAYEDGAHASFSMAKKINMPCYYDLPIGYWRTAKRLLQNEIEKWPEWVSTLTGFKDSEIKLNNKDEELRLADHIFVASSFTAKTLLDFPGELAPVTVVPYGFPPVNKKESYSPNGPLKLLFVGGLSQRKGIANLFTAVEKFGRHVELTVVGRKASENCLPLNQALAKHKWIPSLSHADVLNLMQTQDVFAFPSLFEGFGLVITEAMSQGLPVITTDRTAGADLIQHNENGWMVEAGSTLALEEMIEKLLSNRSLVADMGIAAQKTAEQRPWAVYGQELAEAIIKVSN